jgi:hypothetical protein
MIVVPLQVGATNDPVPYAHIGFKGNAHHFEHVPILITSAFSHTEEYHWHIGR